jgi:hypothetical protein
MNTLSALLKQDASIVPINSGKASISGWKKYQSQAPTEEELSNWLVDFKNFGIIAGYGGFQVLDIDLKNLPEQMQKSFMVRFLERIPEEVAEKFVIQATRNKGLHLIYKCFTETKKEVLAKNEETGKPIIETIGPNNYALIHPSEGYEILHGSLENVQELTESEHINLLKYCRSLKKHNLEMKDSNHNVTSPVNVEDKKFIEEITQWIRESKVDITRDYKDWLKIGYSIGNTFGDEGRKYYHTISSTYPNYEYSFTDAQYNNILSSIMNNMGTELQKCNISTLRYIAKEKGFPVKEEKGTLGESSSTAEVINYIVSKGLYLNTFTGRVEDKEGEPWTDGMTNSLYLEMKKKEMKVHKNDVLTIILSNDIHRTNPLKDWLIDASKSEDADSSLIEGLLDSLILKEQKIEHRRLLREITLKWLLQFPATILDDAKPRIVLVLIGGSYIGKTEFFRRLLPEKINKKYCAESGLNYGKDSERLLCERILINMDELAGILQNKKEIEKFKSLVSSSILSIRPVFGQFHKQRPRRAVLGGTSNRSDIIKDQTAANTRIIPLELLDIDKETFNSINKNDLFGALTNMYLERKGKDSNFMTFTGEELEFLKEYSGEYTEFNPEKELIREYLEKGSVFVPKTRIVEYLKQVSSLTFSETNLTRELKALGFEHVKRRYNKSKNSLWGFLLKENL